MLFLLLNVTKIEKLVRLTTKFNITQTITLHVIHNIFPHYCKGRKKQDKLLQIYPTKSCISCKTVIIFSFKIQPFCLPNVSQEVDTCVKNICSSHVAV